MKQHMINLINNIINIRKSINYYYINIINVN
jgi:hypothetical protein